MPIKNVTIPERTVKVGKDGEIIVRGISLSDLMTIVNVYGPQASIVFGKIQKLESVQVTDVKLLIATVAKEFPDMVAAAIALAADSYDDETVELLKRIPFHNQIEVIEAIFGLTFTQDGEIKKLLATVTAMLAEVSGALKEIQLPLPTGTGEFADL